MENTRRILGIPFFTGTAAEAVSRLRCGGLLVVPAAPALNNLPTQGAYREALLGADLAIPDSGFMVLIWNLMERNRIRKLSGPKYVRVLLEQPDVRAVGNTFWVMAGEESARRNLAWLANRGITVPQSCVYVAPMYGDDIEDQELLKRIEQHCPKHVIITIGGGKQERLGLYLKRNLCYRPAIHCIGAAIAFLSGDQVRIPAWADNLYLGWLFRCLSEPKQYAPRYWSARTLLMLMLKYRSELPPLRPSTR